MKNLFPFLVILLAFNSCNTDEEETTLNETTDTNTSICKIMPLGASRIEGARPDYESFRYELWKDLIDGGWSFDFIGAENDDASYPDYNSTSFDKDHAGKGGFTSEQILNEIDDWLNEAGKPDIVLFSSPGGNDGLQNLPFSNAVSNINAIIDAIQEVNPNVIIFIEQMAPGHSEMMTDEFTDFTTKMQNEVATIALKQTTVTSKVIAIDMFTGFSDSMLADDVHYNDSGADFIAKKYYSELIKVLEK